MKFLDSEGVRQFKEYNDSTYITATTVGSVENPSIIHGEVNVIETVQVNGTALTVTNKTVNVPVPNITISSSEPTSSQGSNGDI